MTYLYGLFVSHETATRHIQKKKKCIFGECAVKADLVILLKGRNLCALMKTLMVKLSELWYV